MTYYDRSGKLISLEEWVATGSDQKFKRVELTEVGSRTVSTVWLGLDHGLGNGPPLIFESMVFSSNEWKGANGGLTDLDCRRYATEEEARVGHWEIVEELRKGSP